MQQVLNNHERTQTFIKFLLFFLITVLVIVFAVFFDFRMPTVENKRLKSEVYDQRQMAANQDRFANKLQVVTALLDSIERNPETSDQIRLAFTNQLTELNNLNTGAESVMTANGKVNNTLINGLAKMNDLIKKNEDLTKKLNRIGELETQLKDCRAKLNETSPAQVVN